LLMHGTKSKVRNMRSVMMAANTASGTNINASEETKDVWKWIAIPRTMREKAATTTKREVRRMLKRECMVTNGDRSEWKTAVVEGVE
jgi:hypothetical protein